MIVAPFGNWVSNKAKVKPLNLSFRSAEGFPNSISSEKVQPIGKAGVRDSQVALQPMFCGLGRGPGERVDDKPRDKAGCGNHQSGEGGTTLANVPQAQQCNVVVCVALDPLLEWCARRNHWQVWWHFWSL
ncbi:MAG: hypothetical protein ACKPKO_53130, partial [Candidatus Fonsibacter sp.]